MFHTSRTRTRKYKVVAAIAALALLAGGSASADAAEAGQVGLMVSDKSTLANPIRLSHAAVSGKAYVFIKSDAITKVAFYLDDPTGSKRPATTDTSSPFMLGGTAGMDTSKLKTGVHTVLAEVTSANGVVDLFARFEVTSGTASGAETTADAAEPTTTMKKPAATTAKPALGGATSAAPKITGVTWKNDFENGMTGFKSTDWNRQPQSIAPSKVVKAPGGGTGNALEFVAPDGAQRNENEPDIPNQTPGEEFYYQWSMFFPADYQCHSGGWNIIMQWHGNDTTSPPLAMDIHDECVMRVGGDGQDGPKPDIGPIQKGKWTTYTLHVGFGEGNDGFIEAWENGALKVPKTNRKTVNGGSDYLKMGIYRDPDGAPSQTVYFDNMVFGTGIAK